MRIAYSKQPSFFLKFALLLKENILYSISSLWIIPTPWEVTLLRLLSIVLEWYLKYKQAK